MSTHHPTDGQSGRSTSLWLPVAALVALVLIVGGLWLGLRGGEDEPADDPAPADTTSQGSQTGEESGGGDDVTALTAPADPSARCMAPNAEVLGRAEVAFDGTVTSISPGVVELEPTTWYAGASTATVRVEAPSSALDGLIQSVTFAEGKRYLVAATDGQVMICGFSGPYEAGRERLYRTAFAE